MGYLSMLNTPHQQVLLFCACLGETAYREQYASIGANDAREIKLDHMDRAQGDGYTGTSIMVISDTVEIQDNISSARVAFGRVQESLSKNRASSWLPL